VSRAPGFASLVVTKLAAPAKLVALIALAGGLALGPVGCHFDRPPPLHPDSPPGAWYVVEKGETLEQIASRAGVPPEDILELNGLSRASDVTPGRIIYVLEARAPAGVDGQGRALAAGGSALGPGMASGVVGRSEMWPPTPGSSSPSSSLPPGSLMRAALANGARFRWPLDRTNIGSPFGRRDGRLHEGIDLPAPMGTPVYAAGDGQVVYAGDAIRGYGNLLVVQHEGDLLTVYAHNSQLLVREGDRVAIGQRIALVGQSGRATGPHLHFEVRSGQIPRDPMAYLPHSDLGGAP
jgi:lipoprotein NlpD